MIFYFICEVQWEEHTFILMENLERVNLKTKEMKNGAGLSQVASFR